MQITHRILCRIAGLIVLAGLVMPVTPVPAQDLNLSGDLESGLYKADDGQIVVDQETTVGQGKTVTFAASQDIILQSGFHAVQGSEFRTVTITVADADTDGLQDWWENLYGLDVTQNNSLDDPDGDGDNNLKEFLAQTDPTTHEKPSVVFIPSVDTITEGQSSVLSWDVKYADTVSLYPDTGVLSNHIGNMPVSPSATTTYTITATGTGGTTTKDVTITVSPDRPVIMFKAYPLQVVKGSDVTLSWHTVGAQTVAIDNGIGSQSLEGSVTVNPGQTTIYELTATNSAMETSKATVRVEVTYPNPTVTLSAAPIIVTEGGTSKLTWTYSNAESLVIDNGVGSVLTMPEVTVTPGTSTTYTITATGESGATAQASVTVGTATDEDNDGMADIWEEAYGITDPYGDPDGDLLNNLGEYENGTDPLAYNAVDVYLTGDITESAYSGQKIYINEPSGQAAIASDADIELLANCDVVIKAETIIHAGAEVVIRSGDCDHLPDAWEETHFGTLAHGNSDDPDGDGLTNVQELMIGSDPNLYNPDTDNDGLADAWELTHFGNLDQDRTTDHDLDGVLDWIEEVIGTDPNDAGDYPQPGNYYEYDDVGRIKRLIRIN